MSAWLSYNSRKRNQHFYACAADSLWLDGMYISAFIHNKIIWKMTTVLVVFTPVFFPSQTPNHVPTHPMCHVNLALSMACHCSALTVLLTHLHIANLSLVTTDLQACLAPQSLEPSGACTSPSVSCSLCCKCKRTTLRMPTHSNKDSLGLAFFQPVYSPSAENIK